MRKELLCLSLSNFFSVYTKLSLEEFVRCRTLNLRVANEEFSQVDNDLYQIETMFFEDFQQRGLAPLALPYQFDAYLAGRIERHLQKHPPSMVFIEFFELGETEFKLLKFVQSLFDGPIAVMIPDEEKTTNKIYQLLTHGVKEVMSDYDKGHLRKAFLRHINPYSE